VLSAKIAVKMFVSWHFPLASGLGFDQPTPAIGRIIAEFVQSGGPNNLVFSPQLTSREQQIIFLEVDCCEFAANCQRPSQRFVLGVQKVFGEV